VSITGVAFVSSQYCSATFFFFFCGANAKKKAQPNLRLSSITSKVAFTFLRESSAHMSANVLSGEVHRHWDLTDAAGSRHVLSLIHDCSSGSRVALLDYAQLPGSFGTTNCVNILFGSTRVEFTLPTGECGVLKIRRDGVFGFKYHCEVSCQK
jgi:hypothetical protein